MPITSRVIRFASSADSLKGRSLIRLLWGPPDTSPSVRPGIAAPDHIARHADRAPPQSRTVASTLDKRADRDGPARDTVLEPPIVDRRRSRDHDRQPDILRFTGHRHTEPASVNVRTSRHLHTLVAQPRPYRRRRRVEHVIPDIEIRTLRAIS
ncbi:hypothetical protein MKK75_31005 [Methylobacterium sp. J-030]|uniref:hypothetical protein n=1 Tax=Methylobacterium sp. J-030 TaxID=2836627 RepID=UPI001FBA1ED9|nr:hypothetical protein [Methylobacterium sp. J-030]MCJ2073163.1 hypothetical protein [Methylobacterium sp. J-030]